MRVILRAMNTLMVKKRYYLIMYQVLKKIIKLSMLKVGKS